MSLFEQGYAVAQCGGGHTKKEEKEKNKRRKQKLRYFPKE